MSTLTTDPLLPNDLAELVAAAQMKQRATVDAILVRIILRQLKLASDAIDANAAANTPHRGKLFGVVPYSFTLSKVQRAVELGLLVHAMLGDGDPYAAIPLAPPGQVVPGIPSILPPGVQP